jgi:hypothetical protein
VTRFQGRRPYPKVPIPRSLCKGPCDKVLVTRSLRQGPCDKVSVTKTQRQKLSDKNRATRPLQQILYDKVPVTRNPVTLSRRRRNAFAGPRSPLTIRVFQFGTAHARGLQRDRLLKDRPRSLARGLARNRARVLATTRAKSPPSRSVQGAVERGGRLRGCIMQGPERGAL